MNDAEKEAINALGKAGIEIAARVTALQFLIEQIYISTARDVAQIDGFAKEACRSYKVAEDR